MKRLLTRSIAAILAAAMMLTGCASDDSSSATDSTSSAAESVTDSSAADTSSDAPTSDESAEADSKSKDDSSDDNKQPSSITPLMWEITSSKGNKMTLIGSMHALKDDAYPLPQFIMDAYNNSDVLAVECDVKEAQNDLSLQLSQVDKMFYSDGSTVDAHIGTEMYNNIVAFAERCGSNLSIYNRCKPWALISLLESFTMNKTDLKSNNGFDIFLLSKAHDDNKEIFEIESAKFQMDLFTSLSDEMCLQLLDGYKPQNYELLVKNLEDTYTAWCKGDLKFFENNLDVDASAKAAEASGNKMDEKSIEMLNQYNQIMVYDRNKVMADKAAELLESGKNVLFVVGAAHFPGDKGIIKLLEQKGYTVTQTSPK